MAITALHSAATGLRALSTRIDVVANNLANAETTAFKRSRVNFEDLILFAINFVSSIFTGRKAPMNPWNANTLE